MQSLSREIENIATSNTRSKISKVKRFLKDFVKHNGCSDLIKRYDLPEYCAYSSGDGIFRNDSTIGKEYKFFRFSPTLKFKGKTSNCWDLSDNDKEMIRNIHSSLHFPKIDDDNYHGSGGTIYYIKFFGFGEKICDDGIRNDIRKAICKRPCANCGTTAQIECDHKNDLKNDPRVLNKNTQTIDDFQALCKHCNDVKRGALKRTKDSGKRHPAPGFKVGFTKGDETYDTNDPNWYIGTYWGDILAFKEKLGLI